MSIVSPFFNANCANFLVIALEDFDDNELRESLFDDLPVDLFDDLFDEYDLLLFE